MGKTIKIIVAFIVLVAIGGGAYFYFVPKDDKAEEHKSHSAEEIAEMSIDTDVITTNLASAGNFGIVQFNILLSDKETKEEAEKRTAEVRAAVISTVASFTKDELVGESGIKMIEEELIGRLAEVFEKGTVERVLVTEFKMQ
ncbi:Flagellar biosynthesis protein FliL [Planococcus halocryophilus Or1]|uniref:Flagellar protein FliL n=1 Tax=Planococcus halocryophilus TaxID=1215089 RepID=A0A1C7DT81_9BACL|nr:flagellar basal body-associated FliL family protein [Planococcus halocryophilus]ANU14809.1 flagellar basal body-associated protein FliL [Planococcus halocryophilus]EMF45180.1 Flagellar biosynthesis protein FliL [Planococcus halocryophilus Or1]